mmetsp:Transcript_31467/g.86036  ORF Transcript_31467/g.86036 Transcript_31467/m.86036 type:complete len:388 (+) Transcript_31467:52-1215(+)
MRMRALQVYQRDSPTTPRASRGVRAHVWRQRARACRTLAQRRLAAPVAPCIDTTVLARDAPEAPIAFFARSRRAPMQRGRDSKSNNKTCSPTSPVERRACASPTRRGGTTAQCGESLPPRPPPSSGPSSRLARPRNPSPRRHPPQRPPSLACAWGTVQRQWGATNGATGRMRTRGGLVEEEHGHEQAHRLGLLDGLPQRVGVVEGEDDELVSLGEQLRVTDARGRVERQLVVAQLHHILHLPEQVADLPRLAGERLRQDDGQQVRVVRTQRSADRRRVRAGGARGEDVVVREHERVREQLYDLLVQEAAVPRAQDHDVLRRPLLDALQLLEDRVDGKVRVVERRRTPAAAAEPRLVDRNLLLHANTLGVPTVLSCADAPRRRGAVLG